MNPATSKAQELLARIERQQEESAALKSFWEDLFPEFPAPGQRQFQIWLKLYDFDTVVAGLEAANIKLAKRADLDKETSAGPMDREDIVRYASGVMKGIKLEQQ